MAEIFISYSRRDNAFVRKLHAALEERGRGAWVDWEGIPASDKWLATIRSAIDEADAVLFVISPDSVTSDVCRTELEHAVKQHKRLIPVVHRDPDENAVQQELSELNYIFAREADSFDAAFEVLIAALDTDLEWTRAHTRLLVRTADWDRQGRDASFTLRGRDLSDFEEWLAKSPDKEPKPTSLQSEYLLASRRAVTRRQQFVWGSLAVGLGIAVVLATFGYFQNRERARQETIAEARQLVNRADAFRDESIMESTRYATQALATLHGLGIVSVDADQAVRKSFAALPRGIDVDLEHQSIDASAFDAQGAYLALFLGRKRLMVWDTVHWKDVGTCDQSLVAMKSAVAVAVARNGAHAVSAVYNASGESGATEITVWSMQDCSRKFRVEVPGRKDGIALAGSGKFLFLDTGSAIRVWDVASHTEQPVAVAKRVIAFAANPDGRRLATVERDHGQRIYWVRVRDLETRMVLREWTISGRTSYLQWRGNALVVGERQSARSYDSESGELLHSRSIEDAGFAVSPDGGRIALLQKPDIIHIRDVATDVELARTSHGTEAGNMAFGPHGNSLISVDKVNRRIRLWMFDREGASAALPEPAPIAHMQFAEDSSRVYIATTEEITKAWLLPTRGQLAPPIWRAIPGESTSLLAKYQFEGPNGVGPVVGSATITLHPADGEGERRTIELAGPTLATSISKNGDWLAVTVSTGSTRGGDERRLEIWDTVANTRIAERAFGPVLDSRTAAYLEFAGDDGFVAIGTRTGVEIMEINGLTTVTTLFHPNVILTAVSDNGSLAASMVANGVVRIWEVGSGDEVARVEAARDVYALALSNDRRWLATLEGEGTVRLWALAPKDLIQQACYWVGERCPLN